MPRPQTWNEWHKELDQIFDSCQTLSSDASGILDDMQRLYGRSQLTQAYNLLSTTIHSERQRRLMWYHDTFGVIGLAHCVYLIALEEIESEEGEDIKCKPKRRDTSNHSDTKRKRQKLSDGQHADKEATESSDEQAFEKDQCVYDHSSWHHILNDYRRGSESRMLFMLSSIPQEVLGAILDGNIPERMQHQDFREKYGPWLSLEDTQGTYAAYVAVNPSHCPNRAGEGLTLQDMLDTIHQMFTYISTELDESRDVAKHIDNQFDAGKNKKINYQDERKFGCGSDGSKLDTQEYWLRQLNEIYSARADILKSRKAHELLQEHLSRCLVYCGASGSCLRRGPEHWTLRGGRNTSPLWGLFLSTLKSMFENKYTATNYTYQILRTVHREDIGLDEIVTSVIHSGYWWDSGLNLTWAGTASSAKCSVAKLTANAVFIRQSGYQSQSIKDSLRKVESVREVIRHSQYISEEDIETQRAIETKVREIEQVMEEVQHLKAIVEHEELMKLFRRFEEASI